MTPFFLPCGCFSKYLRGTAQRYSAGIGYGMKFKSDSILALFQGKTMVQNPNQTPNAQAGAPVADTLIRENGVYSTPLGNLELRCSI